MRILKIQYPWESSFRKQIFSEIFMKITWKIEYFGQETSVVYTQMIQENSYKIMNKELNVLII